MIKRFIPSYLKIQYQLYKRASRDKQNGFYKNIAQTKQQIIIHDFKLTVEQPLKQNKGLSNKIHNIKLAYKTIDSLIIKPGEWFSFWHFIPQPNHKNNFRKGRNLLDGKLQEDYGGGLCQLSGMIYIAVLRAGLEIKERHNHSIDIYTDDTRYTPLGSDATVVYGYKDLRFKNTLQQDLSFKIEVLKSKLKLHLMSNKKIQVQTIEWILTNATDFKTVKTVNEKGNVIAISKYKI